MKLLPLLTGLCLVLAFGCGNSNQFSVSSPHTGQLQPWDEDPNYWTWDGETPELLLGGSSSDALFLEENFKGEIALLEKTGGNYLRCTLRSLDDGKMTPFFWEEGFGKFNLLKYREEYWNQLAEMISYAENIGVAVEIIVWDFPNATKEKWDINPWANNVLEASGHGQLMSKDFLPG